MTPAETKPTPRPIAIDLGQVVATPGAMESVDRMAMFHALNRHAQGDWGDVPPEDKEANDRAAMEGNERILSSYSAPFTRATFWIITEADRSATTILLPEEY